MALEKQRSEAGSEKKQMPQDLVLKIVKREVSKVEISLFATRLEVFNKIKALEERVKTLSKAQQQH